MRIFGCTRPRHALPHRQGACRDTGRNHPLHTSPGRPAPPPGHGRRLFQHTRSRRVIRPERCRHAAISGALRTVHRHPGHRKQTRLPGCDRPYARSWPVLGGLGPHGLCLRNAGPPRRAVARPVHRGRRRRLGRTSCRYGRRPHPDRSGPDRPLRRTHVRGACRSDHPVGPVTDRSRGSPGTWASHCPGDLVSGAQREPGGNPASPGHAGGAVTPRGAGAEAHAYGLRQPTGCGASGQRGAHGGVHVSSCLPGGHRHHAAPVSQDRASAQSPQSADRDRNDGVRGCPKSRVLQSLAIFTGIQATLWRQSHSRRSPASKKTA